MAKTIRSIRLSQIISTFGVGAIYDILGESLILCDTHMWPRPPYNGRGEELVADRLISSLKSQGYRINKIYEPQKKASFFGNAKGTLPYMRFPRWLFCSKCRKMKKWKYEDEKDGQSPACNDCGGKSKLTPMRFIAICDHGHMGDVDWGRWAHSRTTKDDQKTCYSEDHLEFLTGFVKTGGLESVAVRCRKCGASRSLQGITGPNVVASIGSKCSGKQPWQSTKDSEPCLRKVHIVQRGAGNVYYPDIRSAITIPPESNFIRKDTSDKLDEIRNHHLFVLLKSQNGNDDVEKFLITTLCDAVNCTPEDVEKAKLSENKSGDSETGFADIETEEWSALINENPESDYRDNFVTRHYSLPECQLGENAEPLSDYIDKVVSVVKLREVRVLTGFYRYQPGGTSDSPTESRPVYPDVGKGESWLPGTEVFGEGVFFSLNETALQAWENNPLIIKRIEKLRKRQTNSAFNNLLPDVSPRFVMLHTLSHLLIRRLAFASGYSSASLRERIYCHTHTDGNPRAGILVYTAAGDAEGTLGGLARQAEISRIQETIFAALQEASYCSADPICMESEGQGLDGLNLASCHACSLVAETSCTVFNLLLDRALVVGDGEIPGFFEDLLSSILVKSVGSTL